MFNRNGQVRLSNTGQRGWDLTKAALMVVMPKKNGRREAKIPRLVICVVTLLIFSLLSGCHRDPAIRKQKYLESGKRYSAESKFKEAEIQFANALKIDPNFSEAHYEMAQTYIRLGEFSDAYMELLRTTELAPTNLKARIDLGNLLLAGGRVEDAMAQATAVNVRQPDNANAHALLAAIAVRRERSEDALTEIRRAIDLDPNRAAFHQELAMLLAGDPARISAAEEELIKSARLDPNSVKPRLLLSALYARYGRWQQAERASRDAIAADARSIPARESLAGVFLQQGNLATAEETFRQASSDLADDPQGVLLLADYYARTGQLEKAKVELSVPLREIS